MTDLPKIKFCPKCHRRAANPFAKMNIKVGGGKLVSTCNCASKPCRPKKPKPGEEPKPQPRQQTIIWKDKMPEKKTEPALAEAAKQNG